MIDTGEVIGGSYKHLCQRMAKDGMSIKDVTEIWHTHAHVDHVNADLQVQKESGARIFAHPLAVEILKDSRKWMQSLLDAAGEDKKFIMNISPNLLRGFMNLTAGKQPVIAVTRTFTDGEIRDTRPRVWPFLCPPNVSSSRGTCSTCITTPGLRSTTHCQTGQTCTRPSSG